MQVASLGPCRAHEGATLPAGLDIHRALAAQGRPERVQSWRLLQRGERRAYWCAPLDWLHWPGSPVRPAHAPPSVDPGCFVDADQLKALRAVGLLPQALGGSLTWDGFGLRTEIGVAGIAVGLRWIWPGAFLMGSPLTEPGRFDRERQHEVVLTRGYWLAETACTQALWQAVMGGNPSYQKGPQHPVESVSWGDVQRFTERLNAGLPDPVGRASARPAEPAGAGDVGLKPELPPDAPPSLRFRLPTEAEWEYACRAGTATAYSFGDTFDPALANLSGETVTVGSLPPNPWGLYEMHGNVYE